MSVLFANKARVDCTMNSKFSMLHGAVAHSAYSLFIDKTRRMQMWALPIEAFRKIGTLCAHVSANVVI